MVDVAVTLPEPRPDDDEDVVWGLSTATALWARGERGDAIVWIRRAAESASAAGYGARGAELVAAASRVEKALEEIVRASLPPLVDARPAVVPPESEPAKQSPAVSRPPLPSVTPPTISGAIEPPPRAPLPSYTFIQRPRVTTRAPILDPWAEEQTLPSMRVDPSLRGIHLEGDEVVVQMRRPSQPRGLVQDDDDVVTSAAPLEITLRNASRPPPAKKPTDQPPSHIADAAVPSKTANRPPPPLPPRAPSSDAGRASAPSTDRPAPAPRPPSVRPRPPSVPPRPPSVPPPTPVSSSVLAALAPSSGAPSSPPPRPAPSAPKSSPTLPIASSTADAPTMPSSPSPLRTRSIPPAPLPNAEVVSMPPPPRVPTLPLTTTKPASPASPSSPAARLSAVPPSSLRVPGSPSVRAPSSTAEPTSALRPASSPGSGAPTVPRPGPSVRPPPRSATLADAPSALRAAAAADARSAATTLDVPRAPRVPAIVDNVVDKPATRTVEAPSTLRPSQRPPMPTSRPPMPSALTLDDVAAFSELAPDVQRRISELARVDALGEDEEVSGFGAVLVLDGKASVCATIVDAPVAPAPPRVLVTTRGTLHESVPLRVVAGAGGARVAMWEPSAIEDALRAQPDVLQDLTRNADRLQALAGATMGPLQDLDDATRASLFERLEVRVVRAGELVVDVGAKLMGVTVVCVGSVDLGSGAGIVRAGELLFPRIARRELCAPTPARAGSSGAILLVGDRALADRIATIPALAGEFAD